MTEEKAQPIKERERARSAARVRREGKKQIMEMKRKKKKRRTKKTKRRKTTMTRERSSIPGLRSGTAERRRRPPKRPRWVAGFYSTMTTTKLTMMTTMKKIRRATRDSFTPTTETTWIGVNIASSITKERTRWTVTSRRHLIPKRKLEMAFLL